MTKSGKISGFLLEAGARRGTAKDTKDTKDVEQDRGWHGFTRIRVRRRQGSGGDEGSKGVSGGEVEE
jgi:hypothetical protein